MIPRGIIYVTRGVEGIRWAGAAWGQQGSESGRTGGTKSETTRSHKEEEVKVSAKNSDNR